LMPSNCTSRPPTHNSADTTAAPRSSAKLWCASAQSRPGCRRWSEFRPQSNLPSFLSSRRRR
jgi:hypothetical protein